MPEKTKPEIIENKHYQSPSVFFPENLLREARRQNNLKECEIPEVCVLDPDGDLAAYLTDHGYAEKSECWACYHSSLYTFNLNGTRVGIVPCAVGASYAVLVAEQLFVSGCRHLISVTSAGIINPPQTHKRFALITESARDEGTSYHYLPFDEKAGISNEVESQLSKTPDPLWFNAKSWTTDAPYRETEPAIEAMKKRDVTCVEMEASALYAYGKAKNKHVICFAHLTNTMAQEEGDFEKGEHFGSIETLDLLKQVIGAITPG